MSVGGIFQNETDFRRMVAADATIDSFVQNSMAFIRKNNFDGIDICGDFQAFCETPEQCSLPSRFKVLLEKFRSAIESENVLPAHKMIISSSAGPRKSQIYKANDDTSTTSTAILNSITTSAPLQDPAATASNESTFFVANSTEISVVHKEASDLKIEIWAPVLAVIFLAVMTTLIIWRIKRTNAKVTQNSVRSDRNANDPNLDDTDYENYGSPYTPYTAYDGYEVYDGYEKYGEPNTEHKKPVK